MTAGWRLQLALGLLSAALLALQLVLMQILAITQWHHFASLVISTALLGFGASGTLLALTRSWCLAHSRTLLPLLLVGCAVAMACLGWLTQTLLRGFDSYLLFLSGRQVLRLLGIILCYLLPFLLGAGAIGLAFIAHVERIGRLYFANLLGSGLGGIFGLLLLWLRPPEQLPALLGLVVLAGAALLTPGGAVRWRLTLAAGSLLCLAALLFPAPLVRSQYKDLQRSLNLPAARITARRPSPYGLVEALSAPALRFAPGLSLTYRGEVPVADAVFSNGNYIGAVLPQPPAGTPHLLTATTSALPFALARPQRVLILHAGTGTEVGLALNQGSAEVVAVEPHRALLALLREEYTAALTHLFDRRTVHLKSVEPRTLLASQQQQYDLILLPTLGSVAGNLGLFALQEQNSLTLEGLTSAWRHLRPEGLLCANSWIDYPLRAPLRLATSLGQLLEQQGIAEPEKQVIGLRSWGTVSICLKRSPLTLGDLARRDTFARQQQFELLLPAAAEPPPKLEPGGAADDRLQQLLPLAFSKQRAQLIRDYPFDIEPTCDDRPFFSQYLRWQSLPQLGRLFGSQRLPFLELGYLIAVVTFVQLSLAAVILILLPLRRLDCRGKLQRWTLVYFGSLGIGFMLVELCLIHRFVLFLGRPVYAAAAVLGILLVSSGCGSFLSSRFMPRTELLARLCLTVTGVLVCYSLLLTPLLELSIALPLAARAALSVLLLAPAGLAMGLPFPLGLRLLDRRQPAALPWAWGINGCLSVVSAALAVILAVEFGFSVVLWLAAAAYGAAAAVCRGS